MEVLAGAGDAPIGLEKGTVLEGAEVEVLEGVTKVILGISAGKLDTTSEVGVAQ